MEQKKGFFRRAVGGYFALLGKGLSGALGLESYHQAKGMLGAAAEAARDSVRLSSCPRCNEYSLLKHDDGYQCRTQVCGFKAATDAEVDAMRAVMKDVDPRLSILAKSNGGNMASKGKSARIVAWLAWAICGALAVYSASWLIDGRWLYAGWVGLVMLYCGLGALRYAYIAHLARAPVPVRKREFLQKPELWFP